MANLSQKVSARKVGAQAVVSLDTKAVLQNRLNTRTILKNTQDHTARTARLIYRIRPLSLNEVRQVFDLPEIKVAATEHRTQVKKQGHNVFSALCDAFNGAALIRYEEKTLLPRKAS